MLFPRGLGASSHQSSSNVPLDKLKIFMIHYWRERMGDSPSLRLLSSLMEALREAEELGWHHCPPGTPEGDHYDRIVVRIKWQEMMRDGKREERDPLWSHKEDVDRPEGLDRGVDRE